MPRIGIAEWSDRYEVSSDGRPLKPGDATRKKARLDYIRLPVKADKWGPGWRKMLILSQEANIDPAAVFGVFCKLLEFAGAGQAGERGVVRNEHGSCATVAEFALLAGFPEPSTAVAIRILSEIRWVFVDDAVDSGDILAENRERPRASRKTASLQERNETRTKRNTNERLAENREPLSDAARDSSSSRLVHFGCPRLRAILGPAMKGRADATVVADIERQVGGLGQDRIADVERQAAKIMGGRSRNPLAVFVAAMKEQGYYRPEKVGDV